MKKIINYEKDILFKTSIGEICSISLEHDFTVDEGFLRGDFIVSGEYKANELSVNKETFNYKLPLEYELDACVDISTLSYDVENFEYNVHGDELSVYIDFGIRYEEKKVEPILPELNEEDLNSEEPITLTDIEEKLDSIREATFDEEVELPKLKENTDIISGNFEGDDYITYHVHIVREGDTLESICSKYNVSLETVKAYNNFESLEVKSKLIIPEVDE